MKINWKVRLKNKAFWLTAIPAFLLIVQSIGKIFGFEIDLNETSETIIAIIDAAFVILAAAGIVIDPTTVGIYDSNRAMTYDVPNDDNAAEEYGEDDEGE